MQKNAQNHHIVSTMQRVGSFVSLSLFPSIAKGGNSLLDTTFVTRFKIRICVIKDEILNDACKFNWGTLFVTARSYGVGRAAVVERVRRVALEQWSSVRSTPRSRSEGSQCNPPSQDGNGYGETGTTGL